MNRDWNGIMFDDVGAKIQKVAKVFAWIGISFSILIGVVMFFSGLFDIEYFGHLILLAPVSVVVGCIMSWLSAITLYGFGKLIEDVGIIRNKKPPVIKVEAEPKSFDPNNEFVARSPRVCRACGNKYPEDSLFCPYCGTKIQAVEAEVKRESIVFEEKKSVEERPAPPKG